MNTMARSRRCVLSLGGLLQMLKTNTRRHARKDREQWISSASKKNYFRTFGAVVFHSVIGGWSPPKRHVVFVFRLNFLPEKYECPSGSLLFRKFDPEIVTTHLAIAIFLPKTASCQTRLLWRGICDNLLCVKQARCPIQSQISTWPVRNVLKSWHEVQVVCVNARWSWCVHLTTPSVVFWQFCRQVHVPVHFQQPSGLSL